MKILHVIPSIDLKYGGPRTAVLEMLVSLKESGADITLATTFRAVPGEALIKRELPFPVHAFPSRRGTKWGVSFRLAFWLTKYMGMFDLVHIHSVFSFSTLVTARICQWLHLPYIVMPHGALDQYSLTQKPFRKRTFFYLFERWNLTHAAAIHCASEYERKAISRVVTHPHVEVISFGTREPQETVNPALSPFQGKISPERNIILFLSRFDPKKGIELLIEAAELLKRRRNDFAIALCGDTDSSYSRRLKTGVRERKLEDVVQFFDFLDGSKKTQAFLSASLFVLPSKDENFGISIVEAMACGLPVIVSDRVGLAELIRTSSAGLVIRLNVVELASAIEYFLDKPEIRRETSERGKALVERIFRWKNITSQMIDFYKSILRRHMSVL